MKNKWKNGSFTIEIAGMMGVILLIIFTCIYANIYVYNKVWLSIAAYEAAVTGSIEETQIKGNGIQSAEDKGNDLKNIGFYGVDDISMEVSKGFSIKVSYYGKMKSVMGGFQTDLFSEGSYQVVCPVTFIRNYRMLQETGNLLEGE